MDRIDPDLAADERTTLSGIRLHPLEKTVRHNGHADLLREAIDGTVGE